MKRHALPKTIYHWVVIETSFGGGRRTDISYLARLQPNCEELAKLQPVTLFSTLNFCTLFLGLGPSNGWIVFPK